MVQWSKSLLDRFSPANEKIPQQNFPSSPGREISLYPFNAISHYIPPSPAGNLWSNLRKHLLFSGSTDFSSFPLKTTEASHCL